MRRVPSGAGEDVDVDADALLGDGQRPFVGTIARIAGDRAALRQHRARFGADLRLDRLAAPVGHTFARGNPPFAVAFFHPVDIAPTADRPIPAVAVERSEEHTSELQSLMRNTYAVFCLK